jgi:PAS domain S-box-containing protein|tara:strand:- start:70152 stop:72272 length:2121 start_codon:yes stop_codon:yes gene_type:complete
MNGHRGRIFEKVGEVLDWTTQGLDIKDFSDIRRSIILSYRMALVFSAILVSATIFFIDRNKNQSLIINLAGRQRTLSQKIAKDLYLNQLGYGTTEQLIGYASLWDSIHRAFRFGDPAIPISESDDPTINNLLREISPYQEKLSGLAKRKGTGTNEELPFEELRAWESLYLTGMDAIVLKLQLEAEADNRFLEFMMVLSMLAFLLFIFALYRFLVKPIIISASRINGQNLARKSWNTSILENTTDIIWAVDQQCRLLAFNSQFTKWNGRTNGQDSGLGDEISKVPMLGVSDEEMRYNYDRVLSGIMFSTEAVFRNGMKDRYFEIAFNPIKNEEGKVTGCSIMGREVTKRVENYNKLSKSEAILREAQSIAKIGDWSYNVDRDRLVLSKQCRSVLDLGSGLKVMSFSDLAALLDPGERKEYLSKIGKWREKGIEVVIRLNGKDGGELFFCQIGRCHFDDNGKLLGMTGTLQDITEVQLEKRKSRKQFDELQNFVHVISHNVRAPISNIKGLMGILEKDGQEDNTCIIDKIGLAVNILDNTVIDLIDSLHLKQIDQSQYTIINLSSVVSEITMVMSKSLEEHAAVMETDFSQCPEIKGIESYFGNILTNLLLNSLTYKSPDRNPSIRLSSKYSTSGNPVIEVSDNGLGMDLNEERRSRIFSMYGRLSGESEGKGMGLYLVKTQVRSMEGEIDVRSVPGRGTVFTMEFSR